MEVLDALVLELEWEDFVALLYGFVVVFGLGLIEGVDGGVLVAD